MSTVELPRIGLSKQTDFLHDDNECQTSSVYNIFNNKMAKQMRLVENDKLKGFFIEEDDHYFKGQNGNIYNKHCFYSNSKALYPQQIHDALAAAFGHEHGFYVNSVVNGSGLYQSKSFFWVDDVEEAYKLLTSEVVLPAIELLPEQQGSMHHNNGMFHLKYSPKFYSHNLSPDDIKNQLYINKLPNDNVVDLESMLRQTFSRFAVSDHGRIKINVYPCKSSNTSYAIVEFKDPLDCSFAIDMTHKCYINYKNRQYALSIRNAKNNFSSMPPLSHHHQPQQHHNHQHQHHQHQHHSQPRPQSHSYSSAASTVSTGSVSPKMTKIASSSDRW